MSKVIRGGTAEKSQLEEGDEILNVDGHMVTPGMTVDEVSAFIRGKEGSVVSLIVRKSSGYSVTVRLVRARLPGSKTVRDSWLVK